MIKPLRSRAGLSLLALLLAWLAPGLAFAGPAREIARQTFPSVVLLVMQDASGQPLSLGSGFFVTPDTVTTNMHVVQGAASGYAKFVGSSTKLDIVGISASDEKQDLALLKIARASAPALPLADDHSASVGDTVFAVGNPEGLEGTFSQGIVSGLRKLGDGEWLQLTAPISPGSSGGPILDESGKVVGVAVATFRDGQNLNFAVPSSRLRSLMAKQSEPVPLQSAKRPAKPAPGPAEGEGTDGVVVRNLAWKERLRRYMAFPSAYTFSLRNNLREPVTDVLMVVIFYDSEDVPIHSILWEYDGVIPPLLAKLMNAEKYTPLYPGDDLRVMTERMEVRILDYRLLD